MPAAKTDVAEENDKPVSDRLNIDRLDLDRPDSAQLNFARPGSAPNYDEQSLARLLEAAYVLQEHNRELRQREVNLEIQRDQLGTEERAVSGGASGAAPAQPADASTPEDYTQTLAQIVETQRQIQARNLQLQAAMDMVAERVVEIARAGGAALGMAGEKSVRYGAVAGAMTLPAGTEVALDKALCVASLRTGQVIRCTDVNAEFLLDVEACQRRGIQSMIAVPVYHDGGIAGGLELYYAAAQAFTEHDVHTCQLMAGLVTEALVREDESASRKSMAERRTAKRQAREKMRPQIGAAADSSSHLASPASGTAAASASTVFACRKCGHPLVGEEQFCGNCGTPRSGEYGPPSLQSKVASLWEMQEALKKTAGTTTEEAEDNAPHPSNVVAENSSVETFGTPVKESSVESATPASPEPNRVRVPLEISGEIGVTALSADETDPLIASALIADSRRTDPESIDPHGKDEAGRTIAADEDAAPSVGEQPWSSAAAARNYLEELAGIHRTDAEPRLWNARRGDIYLAVALVVVAVVIVWGVLPNHPVGASGNASAATAQHKPDPNADLSLFDRMLISLGLAEAPPQPPDSKGNPDTQVWVDLHTALYYCPGSDLYGKTPKGKYTTQRDAQMDSFGPASGRPCD